MPASNLHSVNAEIPDAPQEVQAVNRFMKCLKIRAGFDFEAHHRKARRKVDRVYSFLETVDLAAGKCWGQRIGKDETGLIEGQAG